MPSIAGQSILIIGGSSGIGFAAAKLAFAEGAHVAIASSNPTRAASAVKNLKLSFPDGQIVGHECNLSHDDIESHLQKLFTDVTSGSRPLDYIIYTAVSRIVVKPLQEIDIEYIRAPGQLHFIAPLLIAKNAPRFLKASCPLSDLHRRPHH